MTRVDQLRAEASSLYRQAKTASYPDDSLLHVLHAIELESEADQLERGDIPHAHVIDARAAAAATRNRV